MSSTTSVILGTGAVIACFAIGGILGYRYWKKKYGEDRNYRALEWCMGLPGMLGLYIGIKILLWLLEMQ